MFPNRGRGGTESINSNLGLIRFESILFHNVSPDLAIGRTKIATRKRAEGRINVTKKLRCNSVGCAGRPANVVV